MILVMSTECPPGSKNDLIAVDAQIGIAIGVIIVSIIICGLCYYCTTKEVKKGPQV
eukprot:CAMPEP_0176398196 /NCGR_PEP_ID=MMETSP0126-20121128/45742_1 /TAXON_ID=141414 ORGANISM="Strombidinopsis acuminatum, Strain SPMC142" /NCGR_SAMPLE_ID=MMETSP0126 /ASSEMBLY_ACC=CAM_ASM_000229 /LENGTH=55 /DNA_ID=CAMNT_0017772983 /DNA_START=560 /DNA_END=727 /DNA_ORIENTATION=-